MRDSFYPAQSFNRHLNHRVYRHEVHPKPIYALTSVIEDIHLGDGALYASEVVTCIEGGAGR